MMSVMAVMVCGSRAFSRRRFYRIDNPLVMSRSGGHLMLMKKPLQLGRPAPIPASPDKARLDRVANPHAGTNYVARFTAPEFTCLCPITGQPDFAHFVIDYVPGRFLVESKSLKLYLNSFRNHGAFHEDCTVAIGKKFGRAAQAEISAHRRLLVSARRHADRRVLAGRKIAEGRLDAARSGRRALSRARLDVQFHLRRPAQPVRAGKADDDQHASAHPQHRVQADGGEAGAVDDRADRLSQKEKE